VALMMGRGCAVPVSERSGDGDGDGDGNDGSALDVRELRLDAPGVPPLHDVSFTVGRGEIVGLAGLRGAGASEVLAALFGGFGRAATARVTLGGAPFTIESPGRSIEQGLVYLASDRKKTVLYDLDIVENITLSSLEKLASHGLLSLDREAAVAAEMTGRLRVASPSLRAPARALSGGNQQKVALLRCLAARPRALLLDEPTRGVDVGAKAEIHRALRSIAAAGTGIALVASELPELLELCDRAVVLARGRVVATLEKKDFSRDGLRMALDAPGAEPSHTLGS
jgi:ABC-type sugar transport system ATPase subunit